MAPLAKFTLTSVEEKSVMFLIRAIILRKWEGGNGISLARGADIILEFRFMRKDKIYEGKLHKTCSTKLQPDGFSLVFLT